MWLWMSNIHPSAIQPIPYKLIVKSGDDLRQDMLTLQMLTLFDKVVSSHIFIDLLKHGTFADLARGWTRFVSDSIRMCGYWTKLRGH